MYLKANGKQFWLTAADDEPVLSFICSESRHEYMLINGGANWTVQDLYDRLPKVKVSLSLPNIGLTPFAQAMPDYISARNTNAYRDYYKTEKAHLLTFTKREDWTK